jgi:chaperone modulatory protein CbpM
VSHALIRATRLDLDEFAAAAGVHPDLIRKFAALGLLDAARDPSGRLWFAPGQVAAVARIRRLRAGFALNYAAIGLVTDLLDQIAALRAALRRAGLPER